MLTCFIDLSAKNFKERDGVPDLRRAARFRYASVTLPEVSASFLSSIFSS